MYSLAPAWPWRLAGVGIRRWREGQGRRGKPITELPAYLHQTEHRPRRLQIIGLDLFFATTNCPSATLKVFEATNSHSLEKGKTTRFLKLPSSIIAAPQQPERKCGMLALSGDCDLHNGASGKKG